MSAARKYRRDLALKIKNLLEEEDDELNLN